jgi:hypothetical protein
MMIFPNLVLLSAVWILASFGVTAAVLASYGAAASALRYRHRW